MLDADEECVKLPPPRFGEADKSVLVTDGRCSFWALVSKLRGGRRNASSLCGLTDSGGVRKTSLPLKVSPVEGLPGVCMTVGLCGGLFTVYAFEELSLDKKFH